MVEGAPLAVLRLRLRQAQKTARGQLLGHAQARGRGEHVLARRYDAGAHHGHDRAYFTIERPFRIRL